MRLVLRNYECLSYRFKNHNKIAHSFHAEHSQEPDSKVLVPSFSPNTPTS
jgi:hypothetical protein